MRCPALSHIHTHTPFTNRRTNIHNLRRLALAAGLLVSGSVWAQEKPQPVLMQGLYCDKQEQIETFVYVRNKAKLDEDAALAEVNRLAGETACGLVAGVVIRGAVLNTIHDDQSNLEVDVTEVLVVAMKMPQGIIPVKPETQYVAVVRRNTDRGA